MKEIMKGWIKKGLYDVIVNWRHAYYNFTENYEREAQEERE